MTYSYIPIDPNSYVPTSTGPLAILIDATSNTVSYSGKAAVGSVTSAAVWQISKITTTNQGSVTVQYANGSAAFSQIWDNRALLTYI